MLYSVQIAGANVSDFITEISDIPFIVRNDDYSIVSDTVKMKMSFTFDGVPTINDDVLIYSASTLLYNGVITEKKQLVQSKEWEYVVQNSLQYAFDVKDYKMVATDFEEYVNPYLESKTIFGKSPTHTNDRWISATNLIKAIFNRIGITLDTTLLQYKLKTLKGYSFSHPGSGSAYPTVEEVPDLLVGYDNLYFWMPMLWGIGQQKIFTKNEIDENYSDNGEEGNLGQYVVSLNKVLNRLSQMFGLVFIPKDASSYYIVHNDTIPTLNTNSDMYEENKIKPKYSGITMEYKHLYHPFPSPEYRYSYYPFFPGNPNTFWLEPNNQGVAFIGTFSKPYSNPETTINWINFFYPFELFPSFANICRLILPRVDTKNTIIDYLMLSNVGEGVEYESENQINTNYYSSVNENYINIKNNSGRIPYSHIKRKTYTLG